MSKHYFQLCSLQKQTPAFTILRAEYEDYECLENLTEFPWYLCQPSWHIWAIDP